jgi:hypothetical protein
MNTPDKDGGTGGAAPDEAGGHAVDPEDLEQARCLLKNIKNDQYLRRVMGFFRGAWRESPHLPKLDRDPDWWHLARLLLHREWVRFGHGQVGRHRAVLDFLRRIEDPTLLNAFHAAAAAHPELVRLEEPEPSRFSRPFWTRVGADAIPGELKALDRWVGWRFEWCEGKQGKPGRWTKVPATVRDPKRHASSTKPDDWAPFEDALAAYKKPDNRLDGVGFVFAEGGGLAGIDFDKCLDLGGDLLPWARPYYERLAPGYAEISPSLFGVKAIVRLGEALPGAGLRVGGLGPDGSGAIEIYEKARFFTITGMTFTPWRPGAGQPPDRTAEVPT